MSSMNFDINNDGIVEQVGLDTDGDGRLDTWSTDTTGDGFSDEVAVDMNRDGAADVWMVDRDQDNVLDFALRDNDADSNFEMIPGTVLDSQTVAGPLISFDSDNGTGASNVTPSGGTGGGGGGFSPYFPSTPSYEDTADPDYDGKPNSIDGSDYDPYDSPFKDKDNDGEMDAYDKNPTRYEPYDDAD